MTENQGPEGLGGWLILVGIGVVISPFLITGQVFPIYFQIFSDGTWEVLTTPGSVVYDALWAPIIIMGIIVNIGLVIAWASLAFLFFSKKRIFPKRYIFIVIFTVVFMLADAMAIKLVLPNEPMFDPDTARDFIRTVVQALIWIPYMLVSKRVKATFVR